MSKTYAYDSNATPVFIAGAPRSGTTFLTTCLNSHPQIHITNELRAWNVFNDIRRRLEKPSELLPDHPMRDTFRKTMLKALANHFRAFYARKINGDNLGCSSQTGTSVEQVIKAYGDKNPGYADTHQPGCLDFIAKMMPDAVFLHIHRDPRSCAASYKRIDAYSEDIKRCINIWNRHTGSMITLKEKLGNRVMEICYEDFVSEKGEQLFRNIERHLGVDAAEEPIGFLEREREEPIPYRSPTTPPERLGATIYQDRLTKKEIRLIEDQCAEYMAYFGYERS